MPALAQTAQRRQAGVAVGGDRAAERVGAHAEALVAGQHPHLGGPKPSARAARAIEECAWSEA